MSGDAQSSIIDPSSRRSFLRRSGALALTAGSSVALIAAVGGVTNTAQAEETRNPTSSDAPHFREIRTHENAHVRFLVGALGKAARPKPHFKGLNFKKFSDFATVAQALENTGCAAYLGAAPVILNRDYLAAAGSIALVEARHAGYLNTYLYDPITGNVVNDDDDNASFEAPLSADEVVSLAGPFIKDLNGGPPIDYSDTPSKANDIAILNFALALEYLEAEFYNINVPKFFR